MSKFTTEKRLVIDKGNDFSLEEDYDLVVYKDGRYKETCPDGQKPRKGFLGNYHLYAVRCSPLEINYESSQLHKNNIDQFYLGFSYTVSVTDSQRVVKKLREDPLKKFRKKIQQIVSRVVTGFDWQDIRDFGRFENQVADISNQFINPGNGEMISLGEYLNNYGNEIGLEMEDLNLSRRLTEDVVEPDTQIKELRNKKRVDDVKGEIEGEQQEKLLDDQLRNDEKRTKHTIKMDILKSISGTSSNAIQTIGEELASQIKRPEDVSSVISAFQKIQMITKGISEGATLESAGSISALDSGTAGDFQAPFFQQLFTAIKLITETPLEEGIQRPLLSCLLKLSASFIAEEELPACHDQIFSFPTHNSFQEKLRAHIAALQESAESV